MKTVKSRLRIKLTPGNAVRIARKLQLMTQTRLAEAVNLPVSRINSIETGSEKLPIPVAINIAHVLQVNPDTLLFPND